MRVVSLFLLIVLVLPSTPPASAQVPTGREVVEAYKAQDSTHDSAVEIDMSIINARGKTRERRLKLWTKTRDDGTRMELIRFEAPADVAGTGFLSIENVDRADDNWLYLPALRKTRRVAGTDRQDSFVGTDFTYEDLETEKPDRYHYDLVGADTVAGMPAWHVVATPADAKWKKETAYSKRELWITQEHALLVQEKLYDKDGAYVKRFVAGDVREVPGSDRWRTYRMTMEDVQDGDKTVLVFDRYEIDSGLPTSYFSQRYLTRGR